jgi:hypothetical protein
VVHAAYDTQSNHEVRLGIVHTEEDALSSRLDSSVNWRKIPNALIDPASIAKQILPQITFNHFQFFIPYVLQVMNSLCRLSQSTGLDRVPSLLEVHACGPGNSGMARE